MTHDFEDDAGRVSWLHDAFGDEVATLEIDSSPMTQVMRDGAALRTRRRLALTSGVTALVVLPVAAVAVFGTGGGAGRKHDVSSASPTQGKTSGGPGPIPTPITAPMPLAAPGKANPDFPNDDLVVLADSTYNGQRWRLIRDRYVVAGPEPADVMGDPSSRPHLPFAANWGKPGTIECDFTGLQWGDRPPGTRSDFGAGGGCNPTDDGSITALSRLFNGPFGIDYDTDHPGTKPELTMTGRIDGARAAYMTVTVAGRVSPKLPLIVVPGEENDYYVVMLSDLPNHGYGVVSATLYDAEGHELGSQALSQTAR